MHVRNVLDLVSIETREESIGMIENKPLQKERKSTRERTMWFSFAMLYLAFFPPNKTSINITLHSL